MAETPQDDRREQSLLAIVTAALTKPFGASLHIRSEGGESIWVDGRGDSVVVQPIDNDDRPSDCQIYGASDILLRVLRGERAIENAYLSGRIRLGGDMSVFSRLTIKEKR